jgi:hypothetical protein
MTNETFIQQGWQCPICKTVYSPTTSMCFFCNPNSNKTTTTTATGYNDFINLVKRDTTTSAVR